MAEKSQEGQRGGVNIHGGSVSTGGGDIVGRDKIVANDGVRQIEEVFGPLAEILATLDPVQRAKALGELDKLKQELVKGKNGDDSIIATLTEAIGKFAPAAASALVSAFGTPILGAIAGPVTKYVIGKLRGSENDSGQV